MEPGQVIDLNSGDPEEDAFLERMEKTITPVVKKMNDERCRVAGINSPQEYPLPAPFESMRALFLRTKERLSRKQRR